MQDVGMRVCLTLLLHCAEKEENNVSEGVWPCWKAIEIPT